MEERMLDDEETRKIKLGVNGEGEVDALEEGDSEVLLELPEDEDYDESLVGLTPSQLAKELARRQKAEEMARAEFTTLLANGEEALSREAYDEAESFFAQAETYVFAEPRIGEGLWIARTHNFTQDDAFYSKTYAEEFTVAESTTQAFVREKVGEKLAQAQAKLQQEESEIAPRVEGEQQTRRTAFKNHRNYYLLRFALSVLALVLCAVAIGVSASYLLRVSTNAPLICVAVFSGLAFISLCVLFFFARKLFVANEIYGKNEDLSSTEDGARLKEIREQLYCLNCFLSDEE